jgi:hypothetical protein
MNIVYIDKCRYEIREQRQIPVWYTGPFRAVPKRANAAPAYFPKTYFH